jgi:hypothetical protein
MYRRPKLIDTALMAQTGIKGLAVTAFTCWAAWPYNRNTAYFISL